MEQLTLNFMTTTMLRNNFYIRIFKKAFERIAFFLGALFLAIAFLAVALGDGNKGLYNLIQ